MNAAASSIFLLLGFFIPGWLLSRTLKSPLAIASSFILSSLILFHCIFLLEVFNIRICFLSVAACLAAATAVVLLFLIVAACGRFKEEPSWRMRILKLCLPEGKPADVPGAEGGAAVGLPGKMKLFLIAPAAAMVALMALRSALQPFTVFDGDQTFRWNLLALKIFELGNFSFYPPMSAADFADYFYVDAIPPMVSFSYLWIYACFGVCAKALISPYVTFQYILLLILCHETAKSAFGRREAGTYAVAIFSCSMLSFYSVIIGIETGLTAISAVSTFFFMAFARKGAETESAVLAGFAAALGALSREYGLSFVLIGVLAGLHRRIGAKAVAVFCATFLALALPWYFRTWLLTGNPFYGNIVFGLFPTNDFISGFLETCQSYLGLTVRPALKLHNLSVILLTTAAVPLAAGTASLARGRRPLRQFIPPVLLFALLWAYSAGQTSGGLFHSLRVFSPALAFMAVAGASLFAGPDSKIRPSAGYGILLAAASLACFQDLTTPINVFKLRASEYLSCAFVQRDDSTLVEKVLALPEGSRILSDDAFLFGKLVEMKARRVRLVPVWSPEVAFLRREGISDRDCAEKLKRLGIRYILIQHPLEVNYYYLYATRFSFFRNYKLLARRINDDIYFLE